MFQIHDAATHATAMATGIWNDATRRVRGTAHRKRIVAPTIAATIPNGWYRIDAARSPPASDRTDRVIPHIGHGTPVIVSKGHGGYTGNGITIPRKAMPTHPTTSQRIGASGIVSDFDINA